MAHLFESLTSISFIITCILNKLGISLWLLPHMQTEEEKSL